MATIKQLQNLLNWMKSNTHIKQSAYVKNTELSKYTVSRIIGGQTPISSDHYDELIEYCKEIGYDPRKSYADSQ